MLDFNILKLADMVFVEPIRLSIEKPSFFTILPILTIDNGFFAWQEPAIFLIYIVSDLDGIEINHIFATYNLKTII